MKIFPRCKKEKTIKSYYDHNNSLTEETYRVYYDYYSCDNCLYCVLPLDILCGKEMIMAKELKWNESIIKHLKSFNEIEENFYNRSQVISMIKNYKGEKIHNNSKNELIRDLDLMCLHFVLFSHKYYLKKSVDKYLYCGNGLFPLKGDFLK